MDQAPPACDGDDGTDREHCPDGGDKVCEWQRSQQHPQTAKKVVTHVHHRRSSPHIMLLLLKDQVRGKWPQDVRCDIKYEHHKTENDRRARSPDHDADTGGNAESEAT